MRAAANAWRIGTPPDTAAFVAIDTEYGNGLVAAEAVVM